MDFSPNGARAKRVAGVDTRFAVAPLGLEIMADSVHGLAPVANGTGPFGAKG